MARAPPFFARAATTTSSASIALALLTIARRGRPIEDDARRVDTEPTYGILELVLEPCEVVFAAVIRRPLAQQVPRLHVEKSYGVYDPQSRPAPVGLLGAGNHGWQRGLREVGRGKDAAVTVARAGHEHRIVGVADDALADASEHVSERRCAPAAHDVQLGVPLGRAPHDLLVVWIFVDEDLGVFPGIDPAQTLANRVRREPRQDMDDPEGSLGLRREARAFPQRLGGAHAEISGYDHTAVRFHERPFRKRHADAAGASSIARSLQQEVDAAIALPARRIGTRRVELAARGLGDPADADA